MSWQKQTKLNKLQDLLPEGLVASAAWLTKQGYSSALRNQYVRSGWLEQPARGVFRRPGGPLKWQHVVISMQHLLDIHPFVGGRTALELHGYEHYVSQSGPNEIHLFHSEKPPSWLFKLNCNATFVWHSSTKLFRNDPIHRGGSNVSFNLNSETVTKGERYGPSVTEQLWGHWDWPITLSTTERAILELLDEVPSRETFHQVDMIFEGLGSLSSRRLQELLEDCKNVKVKRLFLWFAKRHGFRWVQRLDESLIDLGSGKRSLIKGGHLDQRYLITVPKDMASDG